MPSIEFVVEGTPVPKGRPRLGKHGTYTPDKTRLYERRVAYCAREVMRGRDPIDTVVQVELRMYFPLTATLEKSKSNRQFALDGVILPIGKTDGDNCLKSVLDACNGIIYIDDNLVCEAHYWKYYSDKPRIEMKVEWNG